MHAKNNNVIKDFELKISSVFKSIPINEIIILIAKLNIRMNAIKDKEAACVKRYKF